jgi:DNA modification methylase
METRSGRRGRKDGARESADESGRKAAPRRVRGPADQVETETSQVAVDAKTAPVAMTSAVVGVNGSPVSWSGEAALRPFLVPVVDLVPDPRNARRHGARNLEAVKASLESFGQHRLAVAQRREDGSRVVRVGNGMLAAAVSLGWSHLATLEIEEGDEAAMARAIADNRSSELAEWDHATLSETLAELERVGGTVGAALSAGFTAGELDAIRVAGDDARTAARVTESFEGVGDVAEQPAVEKRVDVAEKKTKRADEVPEAPARPEPVSRVGDLWELGRHRLLCGDSTDFAIVDRVLDGKKLDVVFTDPPFAIYGSSTGVDQSVADDSMVKPFFRLMARSIERSLRSFGSAYVCCDWRSYPAIREESRGLLEPKNLIVWTKEGFSRGFHYTNNHELISFFVKVPRATSMFARETGYRQITDSNVWKQKVVPVGDRHHFAQKPTENVARAISNASDVGGLVGDFFPGSGTTLLVCEEIGRTCFCVEILPRMVDVIVCRWQEMTGQKAMLVSGGDRVAFDDVRKSRDVSEEV